MTVAVIAVLAASTVLLIALKDNGGENPTSSDTASSNASADRHYFFDYAKEDIATVEITNEYGTYTLKRIYESESSRIVLVGNEEETIFPSTASAAFNSAVTISSTTLVSEDSSKLAEYGLNAPSITVKTTLNDGTVRVLNIGIESPSGGYYVNTSELSDVYLITSYAASNFQYARTDYYPLDLFGTYESLSFTGLTVHRPDYDIDDIRLSDEDYEAAVDAAEANIKSQLELASPFKFDVNSVYMDDLVKAISGLQADEVVSDDMSESSLASYGLDASARTLLIKNDGKKLIIGNKDEQKGVYYVMLDGRRVVYAVSAESLAFIEDGADRYAYTMIGLVALKNVKTLVIETANKTYEFVCSDVEDLQYLEVTCGGKELPPDEFKKLYQQIFSATQNGLAEKPESDLFMRITYNKKDGTKSVIEYYKIDMTRYYAEVNGVGYFSVKSDMVEKIPADCERILNGEIITLV